MQTNTNKNSEFKTCCPSCKLVMMAQNEWLGLWTECPKCKAKFIIQATTNKAPKLDLSKFFTKKTLLALGITVFVIAVIITLSVVSSLPSSQSRSSSGGLSGYEKTEWKYHFQRKYRLSEQEADDLVSHGYFSNSDRSIDVMYKVQALGLSGDFKDDLNKLQREMGR